MKLEENKNWLAVKTAKTRAYRFTHFNYTDEIEQKFKDLEGVQYLVYGYEICPTTKRPHLQGFIYFLNERSGRMLIKQFPVAQWFTCDASNIANSIYCKKEGKIAYEFGTCPMDQKAKGQSQKETWAEVARLADAGDFRTIADQYPMIDILHRPKLIQRFLTTKAWDLKPLDGELPGVWIHGPPGTGKTTRAREMLGGEPYPKPGNTKWWDNYMAEESVIIDDFDPSCKEVSHLMKIWTDRNIFIAEHKGGGAKIRPKRIIVTSNYTIQECFKNRKDVAAMKRRFPTVIYMPGEEDEEDEEDEIPPPKKRKLDDDVDEIFL